MERLPTPSARLGPRTSANTRCRRVGSEYVDIMGLSEEQLAQRYAWCRAQAAKLAGVPRDGLAARLAQEWDVSAAEAAWVVSALP